MQLSLGVFGLNGSRTCLHPPNSAALPSLLLCFFLLFSLCTSQLYLSLPLLCLLCLCPFAKCVFNVLLIVSSLWLLAEIPATPLSLSSLSPSPLATLATQHCAAN